MILISGSSTRNRRPAAGRLKRWISSPFYKPLCKAAFRVLHAADIGIGVARDPPAVSGRRAASISICPRNC
jgi:oxalyl-CoA decarboxylase